VRLLLGEIGFSVARNKVRVQNHKMFITLNFYSGEERW
jgi:hypothetical protein